MFAPSSPRSPLGIWATKTMWGEGHSHSLMLHGSNQSTGETHVWPVQVDLGSTQLQVTLDTLFYLLPGIWCVGINPYMDEQGEASLCN